MFGSIYRNKIKELNAKIKVKNSMINELNLNEINLKKEIQLDKMYIFYIGDYFHNFGVQTWFNQKEPKNMGMSPQLQDKIAKIFGNFKLTQSFSFNNEHLFHILQDSSLPENILEEIITSNKKMNYLEKKELFYKVLIFELRTILPQITDNNYGFDDKIDSLDDFMNLNYMPRIIEN